MKRLMFMLSIIMFIVVIGTISCKKKTIENSDNISNVIIETAEVTNIANTSAVCGGVLVKNDIGNITGCGVCWSVHHNPTLDDHHAPCHMQSTGLFSTTIYGLYTDAKYCVRAYVTIGEESYYGDEKEFTTLAGLPDVSTRQIKNITMTSAVCGGNIFSDGGSEITACGVCWSISPEPTIDDNHTSDSVGLGPYNSYLTDLESSTIYYVRAYAINSVGISYGGQKVFATKVDPTNVPTGAIAGFFSVSDTERILFSKGNLQYQASTDTWRFAENQWDYVGSTEVFSGQPGGTVPGSSNNLISQTYGGWIDMFGWGTSGYSHGAVCYQPWSMSDGSSNYLAYGNDTCNLNDQTGQADWGYNAIINGGNATNMWRTLTSDEWSYIFNNRSCEIRYVKANINGVNGVILLPDTWSVSSNYSLNDVNSNETSYSSNIISHSDWTNELEANGAVFLPASGWRYKTSIDKVGTYGYYWTATYYDSSGSCAVYFGYGNLNTDDWGIRHDGFAVRLVCPKD